MSEDQGKYETNNDDNNRRIAQADIYESNISMFEKMDGKQGKTISISPPNAAGGALPVWELTHDELISFFAVVLSLETHTSHSHYLGDTRTIVNVSRTNDGVLQITYIVFSDPNLSTKPKVSIEDGDDPMVALPRKDNAESRFTICNLSKREQAKIISYLLGQLAASWSTDIANTITILRGAYTVKASTLKATSSSC